MSRADTSARSSARSLAIVISPPIVRQAIPIQKHSLPNGA